MYLPTFAQLFALAAITATSTASPIAIGKGSSGAVCNQVGITSARAQQVRKAFDDANLVPEAIKSINPKVSQHQPRPNAPAPSQPVPTTLLNSHY